VAWWASLLPVGISLIPSLGHARAGVDATAPLQIQVADSAVLGARVEGLIAAPAVAMPQPALAPAPMPNPDADDPSLQSVASAQIGPALISRYKVFEGDGFSRASNADYGLDEKTKPAAGIRLSVPVK
jgi:hypothetical protein